MRRMHVLVAGCGWLGTALAQVLVARGDRVTGTRRDPQRAEALRSLGIEPLAVDLATPGASGRLPGDVDAVVACQAAGGESVEAYRSAYLAANGALLDAAGRWKLRALVYTGSTGVFGQRDGSTVDEQTPVAPASPTAEVLVEAERALVAAAARGVPTRVVRLSGLYGPGRYGVIDRVRSGRTALGPGDDAWTNWCHLQDAIATVLAALERGGDGAVYHGSDATPLRRRELVEFVAGRLGVAPARSDDASGGRGANRRISSERTRRELGITLAYPSVREGLAPALP